MSTLLLLVACHAPGPAVDSPPVDSATDETATSDSSLVDTAPPRLDLAAAAPLTTAHFATSLACVDCHTNEDGTAAMRDAAGQPIAPVDLWRASMMANAARDPFWWAAVSYEEEPWLRVADDIEGGCMVCHAPSLAAEARLTGGGLPTLDTLRGHDASAVVGLDGVSCAVCHQVGADGLGTTDSFNGEFVTVAGLPAYGPYVDPVPGTMVDASGYSPVYGAHMTDAGMCATCHQVQNTVLGIDGVPTNRHVDEQVVYREWQASTFDSADGPTPRSCQSCHVPTADADGAPYSTTVARLSTGGDDPSLAARDPYGLHTFLGGNAYVLSLLRDNAAELAPDVPAAAFDAQVQATRAFLRTAARLTVLPSTREGDSLRVPVLVENLTGHKLPTGFPSRRMWLAGTVTDATGAVVFRTGQTDEEGRLVNNGGATLSAEHVGASTHPHRDVLEDGQVQVWEAVLRDNQRLPTYLLLVAFGFAKDDRILPLGWDGLDTTLAPVGADGDATFVAGSDTVTLLVDAPADRGPYTVSVGLAYQPIGARHLAEVLRGEGDPVRVLERMVDASDRTPDVIAETTAQVP